METRIRTMTPLLNEKQRRLFLASEAKSYGRGGISKVSQISGVSRTTILAGIKELKTAPVDTTRIREIGGGRKLTEDNIPQVQEKIREIVEDSTYGDPEKLLSWTTESLRTIQVKLLELHNIKISFKTVGSILGDLGYSKQANQKMPQVGKAHPDRNAQFEFINNKAKEFFEASEPVISVDTKKKENLGNLKNNGREYRRKKDPRKSLDHDFFIEELGKIAPYGVYALNDNIGFANVGISHDTAEFAVESISRWWEVVGKFSFPKAQKLFVNYDCGGSTGNRVRLWKYQLAQLSERIGLEIHVSHFPPGTSKWNKIEHKLFCFISKKWEGKPLIDIKTAVKLIGSTKTTKGLRVICQADDTYYELAKKVTDEQFNSIDLVQLSPFDAWNYIVKGFK